VFKRYDQVVNGQCSNVKRQHDCILRFCRITQHLYSLEAVSGYIIISALTTLQPPMSARRLKSTRDRSSLCQQLLLCSLKLLTTLHLYPSYMHDKSKLEIWGKAQRESARRPKSHWEKLGEGVKFPRHQSHVARTQMHLYTQNAHCRLRVGQHERL